MARVPTRVPTTRRRRTRRILASRGVFDAIVSLAGIMGRPVRNQSGQEIGELVDVVARWSDGQTYPPITGLVVKVGRRLAFVDAHAIERIEHALVTLRSARLDLRDFSRRPGEVMLGRDVLDHQLVDVDGVQVIRAADLYLAEVLGQFRLVGVDVSTMTLLRRLGPRRGRPAPTPDRVIDWAAIQPFGEGGGDGGDGADTADGADAADVADAADAAGGAVGADGAEGAAAGTGSRRAAKRAGGTGPGSGPATVRLRTSHDGLHRLRPGELADLLEDLRRGERQELLDVLSPDEAADALEEMQPDDLAQLLRESEPDRAAELVASMEPDEAADALRDLDADHRDELLDLMEPEMASTLRGLLGYREDTAGGFMTTTLVTAPLDETVEAVVDRLAELRRHDVDIDAVAVVDTDGSLLGDVLLLDLLLALRADPTIELAALVDEDEPVTVTSDVSAGEVAEQLVEARRLSLLVVEDGRPIGRILADDVLDALVPGKGRFHFPRLFE
jgi:CBS domain-containing protein